MKKIVQKFGGTSLDTPDNRLKAAGRVKEALDSGYSPVVVVSAMGREGKAYATDTLINLAREVNPEINPREKDLIMSCGEVISSVIMVQTLKQLGIKGEALTGAQAGIITDDNFGASSIQGVDPRRILEILDNNRVPVISGFQGMTCEGEITTLGRGGSDTTAGVIGAAIGALFIEVYTDVEGVMTADPLLVDRARILEEVNYNEICELAYQGARVIHPRAAEIAREASIPIRVKSLYSETTGTLIHDSRMREIASDRPVTGLASRSQIVFITILPGDDDSGYATGLRVFQVLADQGVSLDFINIRPQEISFIIEEELTSKTREILQKNKFDFKIYDDFVKISVIGGGMTGQPGIMSRIVCALSEGDISIYQTTDSHTTISCLIKEDQEARALQLLHKSFELE